METVFRTSDGFVTPWVNWDAAFPVGKVRDTESVNDCVVRMSSDGEWKDETALWKRCFTVKVRKICRFVDF